MKQTFTIKRSSVTAGQRGYIVSAITSERGSIDVQVFHDRGTDASMREAYANASAVARSIELGRHTGHYNGRLFQVDGKRLTVAHTELAHV